MANFVLERKKFMNKKAVLAVMLAVLLPVVSYILVTIIIVKEIRKCPAVIFMIV